VTKISSWVLLVIISFLIVAELKHMREKRRMNPVTPKAAPRIRTAA